MTSKRKKGLALQRKAKAILEKEGFLVHNEVPIAYPIKTPRGTFYISKRNDIFGAIDLIAIKKDSKVRFIQVTADTSISRKLDELKTIPYPKEHATLELWVWRTYKNKRKNKFDVILC